jgi:hypothetical protein
VTVDGDLAIADLAEGAGVLPRHAHGGRALLGKAGVVEDQGSIAFGRQGQQVLHTLLVEVVFVPGHDGEQALEGLFGGARDDRRQRVAVLVGMFGEHAREVAFQGVGSLGTGEVDVEGAEKLVQRRHRFARRERYTFGGLHTSLYARSPQVTKPY